MASLMLVFGHMPFYPYYEVRDRRAYLAGLPERMPTSLLAINVDPDGNLLSVEQEAAPEQRGSRTVVLAAEDLLWYAHDREGAAWWGSSLLRASFGPWLLKQDQMRVSATAQRRFGTAVPTAEVLPGSVPTQGEINAANAAVAQIRVGDEAGITLPPGFRLRLVAPEGNPPDGIALLRYYDEQMARSMLASVLDLGSTSNGSRALGTSFLDILGMALQGVAAQLAETATELCVRLTDLNEGDQANSPAVVVGDVAGSEEALAVTVSGLLKEGALTADPDLEAWVRETYQLPEKPTVSPVPVVPPVPPVPVKAANESVGGAVTQDSGWPYRRPLTTIEAKAGFDPQSLDEATNRVLGDLLRAWPQVQAGQRAQLRDAVEAALAGAGLAALAGITLDTGDAEVIIGAAMLESADAAARLAGMEAAAQGVTVGDVVLDERPLTEAAAGFAAVLGAGMVASAGREALRLAGPAADPAAVADQVAAFLEGLTGAVESDVLAGAVNGGVNAGRAAVAVAAPPVTRWVASEIRDANTCAPCAGNDGVEYASFDAAAEDYPTGGYGLCLGRYRCRGVLIPVWE
jgi:hypothetical protein